MSLNDRGAVALGAVNPNALAVAPEGRGALIFEDGFESGDTGAWG